MKWFETLPGVTGADPLSDGALAAWPDRAFDDRLSHLRACPVVLSELYMIARHFPLIVRDEDGDPTLSADLRPEVLRRTPFDMSGRFAGGYRPLATRLLPFAATAAGGALRLRDTRPLSEVERPAALQQQVAQSLQSQAAGNKLLGAAVRLLIARGHLVAAEAGYDVPDHGAPPTLSPPQDVTRADPDQGADSSGSEVEFLALRVLAVMEFSSIHRRTTPPRAIASARVGNLITRDQALRRQNFLSQDEMIDFSRLS